MVFDVCEKISDLMLIQKPSAIFPEAAALIGGVACLLCCFGGTNLNIMMIVMIIMIIFQLSRLS